MRSSEDGRPDMGTPFRRTVLAEQIAEHILNLIQTRTLRPGQQLPSERELAIELGVSRPSLREALRALSLMGVLVKRHGDGVFVSTLGSEQLLSPLQFFIGLDPGHLEELFEARIVLETGIARVAAQRIDSETLDRLGTCVAEGEKSIDESEEFLRLDMEFHGILVEATENPFLERVFQTFQVLGKVSREITVQIPGVRLQSHSDHQRIFKVLKDHDPEGASRAMQDHLNNIQRAYFTHAKQQSVKGQGQTQSP